MHCMTIRTGANMWTTTTALEAAQRDRVNLNWEEVDMGLPQYKLMRNSLQY